MYKDGRFANLQRQREYDREYRRRRAATETPQEKETKLECWSQRDRESTSRACMQSKFHGYCTRTRVPVPNFTWFPAVGLVPTLFRIIALVPSQPSPVRRQAGTHTQKKQYTSSSVGLAQARPNNLNYMYLYLYSCKCCYPFHVGIVLSLPHGGSVLCRVALICTTVDLPARAAVTNFIQYNGYWGCCQCLQKG